MTDAMNCNVIQVKEQLQDDLDAPLSLAGMPASGDLRRVSGLVHYGVYAAQLLTVIGAIVLAVPLGEAHRCFHRFSQKCPHRALSRAIRRHLCLRVDFVSVCPVPVADW